MDKRDEKREANVNSFTFVASKPERSERSGAVEAKREANVNSFTFVASKPKRRNEVEPWRQKR